MSKSAVERPDPLPDGEDFSDKVLAELEALELVAEDGEPMESDWHRKCMNLLIGQINWHYRGREDYYVGGNMFIYFSTEQAKNRDFRGPAFFFVGGNTTRHPMREYWTVWDEASRLPDVVIELSSPSTAEDDRGVKFDTYRDRMRVPNYFIYDRLDGTLQGWRLDRRRYVALQPDASGRLYSDELDLWLGPWDGEYEDDEATWLRFFDADGRVIPISVEAERVRADVAEGRAATEKQRADAETERADAERQRADAETERADAERQRADAERTENERLRKLLAKLQGAPEGPS